MNLKYITENGINIVLEKTDENEVKLLHFSAMEFDEKTLYSRTKTLGFKLVEVQCPGINRPGERHGNKYIVTAPGYRLKYKDFKDYRNDFGRKIEIITFDEETGLEVTSNFQFFDGISVARSWTTLINKGKKALGIEYVSSFALTGIEKEGLKNQDEKIRVRIPHNSWQRELQWQEYTLEQLGIGLAQPVHYQHSSKVAGATNVGNWSTKEYIPMGYVENTETGSNLFWQIEHNGSWHWEISDQEGHLYLQLSGPSEIESHWYKELKQNEIFESVYTSVGTTMGNFDTAMGELTKYRRAIRRPNNDNESLAVIFNDYMNCLWGDPTAEKEFPLIDAAAQAGCEYFCIDAGWYAKGFWWDWVGEWQESRERFPNGLKEVTDYIRSKGLVPGAWLEIEVMGIKCPMVNEVCDDTWFFTRHGKRVYDRSRYQLDFRNEKVIAHATGVIDKLVSEYGIGYIKMDYNIEPGIGTEYNCDSVGDGLLGHQRAYLKWLDEIFIKYPDLIIENCSSGGLRIDYAMLSRYSIQSTSDQDDYRKYCTIAANSPAALTPEQSAIWSYPMSEGDKEEVVFNMVNAMLLRVHQSGHLGYITEDRKELVKEALDVYKNIRQDIKISLPFWPLGLSKFSDQWVCLGLKTDKKAYIAVWKRESSETVKEIPVDFLKEKSAKLSCIYPNFNENRFSYNAEKSTISVELKENYTARLYEIEF
ncbi:MAG: alpha-galactosidase [Clostridiales bacterium]|nr:alpha-galactosidase [Clostridiales bacterium]